MEKKSVIKLYENGFIIRNHNCRIVCINTDSGWEIHTKRYLKGKDKVYEPTVGQKRNLLCSYAKYSENVLLQIATGINMFNNRHSQWIDLVCQNPKGETIIFETTFTIKT